MAQQRHTAPKPRRRPRPTCNACGEPYYRRNLTELWTTRNEGHRAGWTKVVARICNTCLPTAKAQRVLMVAAVHMTSRRRVA